MMPRSSSIALLVCASVWAAPAKKLAGPIAPSPEASAAPPAPKPLEEVLAGDALVAYEAGRASFKEGDFATCHAKMKKAFELSKNPRLLRNVSTCSAKQRRYAQAIREAELALELGSLTPEAVANLRESLEFWRTFVARATLKVTPAAAEVLVDGAPLALSEGRAALDLDIGKHEVQVTAKGHLALLKSIDVRDTDAQLVEFALAPDVPETKLTVSTGPESRVAIDGTEVSLGPWTGLVRPGPHRVAVSGREKVPFAADVDLALGQQKTLVVDLEDEPRTWLWITGGSVLAAGLAVGGYFLFRPPPQRETGFVGSAGTITIP